MISHYLFHELCKGKPYLHCNNSKLFLCDVPPEWFNYCYHSKMKYLQQFVINTRFFSMEAQWTAIFKNFQGCLLFQTIFSVSFCEEQMYWRYRLWLIRCTYARHSDDESMNKKEEIEHDEIDTSENTKRKKIKKSKCNNQDRGADQTWQLRHH